MTWDTIVQVYTVTTSATITAAVFDAVFVYDGLAFYLCDRSDLSDEAVLARAKLMRWTFAFGWPIFVPCFLGMKILRVCWRAPAAFLRLWRQAELPGVPQLRAAKRSAERTAGQLSLPAQDDATAKPGAREQ